VSLVDRIGAVGHRAYAAVRSLP